MTLHPIQNYAYINIIFEKTVVKMYLPALVEAHNSLTLGLKPPMDTMITLVLDGCRYYSK
jgi:hypothetical protein